VYIREKRVYNLLDSTLKEKYMKLIGSELIVKEDEESKAKAKKDLEKIEEIDIKELLRENSKRNDRSTGRRNNRKGK
jgi:hypothetical protein